MLKAYLSEKEVRKLVTIFRENSKERKLLVFIGTCQRCKKAVVNHLSSFKKFQYLAPDSLRDCDLEDIIVVSVCTEGEVLVTQSWALRNAYKVYWFTFRDEEI